AKRGVGVSGTGRQGGPRRNKSRRAKTWTYIIFTAPALILLLLINLYPVIYAAYQSLRDGTLIDAGDRRPYGSGEARRRCLGHRPSGWPEKE
ncbi:hypothetical protein CTI14_58140, partial [Methylobacterium radiotolerans]